MYYAVSDIDLLQALGPSASETQRSGFRLDDPPHALFRHTVLRNDRSVYVLLLLIGTRSSRAATGHWGRDTSMGWKRV